MQDFKKLRVWGVGMEIVLQTYEISSQLPSSEKYGLKSQLNRAAVSIPSNIAEGASRSSPKDYKRFLEIALGSAFEIETQLLIVERIYSEIEVSKLLVLLTQEQKMLNALITKINRSIHS